MLICVCTQIYFKSQKVALELENIVKKRYVVKRICDIEVFLLMMMLFTEILINIYVYL